MWGKFSIDAIRNAFMASRTPVVSGISLSRLGSLRRASMGSRYSPSLAVECRNAGSIGGSTKGGVVLMGMEGAVPGFIPAGGGNVFEISDMGICVSLAGIIGHWPLWSNTDSSLVPVRNVAVLVEDAVAAIEPSMPDSSFLNRSNFFASN